MSTAALVPETRALTGDDAMATLKQVGRRRLLKDAFRRLRVADGFSHSRSLAFMVALVLIQGVIALVGLASVINKGQISAAIVSTIQRAVPGPAGHVLTQAVSQAHKSAGQHHYSALLIGAVGALLTATTALGQVERGLNRIYGVEQDRPTTHKYGLAFLFAIGVGSLLTAAFACLTFGNDIFATGAGKQVSAVWTVLRWPLGLASLAAAITLLFRHSPRRVQPRLSWLAFGTAVSAVLWGAVTAGLGVFYGSSTTFGNTYGPLAGLVALLVWCLLSSIALFYGAAVGAQLEAVRAGRPNPQDAEKVAESEPEAVSANAGSVR